MTHKDSAAISAAPVERDRFIAPQIGHSLKDAKEVKQLFVHFRLADRLALGVVEGLQTFVKSFCSVRHQSSIVLVPAD